MTDPPLVLDVEVVSRSDGRFQLEDRQSHLASMSGVHIDMGLLRRRKVPRRDDLADQQEDAPLRSRPVAQSRHRA